MGREQQARERDVGDVGAKSVSTWIQPT